MTTVPKQRQFLRVFYEMANQKAPDNLVDVHEVGQRCGLDDAGGEELARLLVDGGLLDNEGTFPAYRLTPRGRQEVREALRGAKAEQLLTPRLTLHLSTLGNWQTAQEASAETAYQVGSQDCAAVASALELLQQSLTQGEIIAGYPQAHVLNVIRELEAEVKQPHPNGLRLRGLLMGLAGALHMTGNHEEADHAVKVALSFLHVDVLP
jgi:hypothetical protein